MDKRLKIIRIMDRLNTGGPAIHAILLTHHMSPRGTARDWETILIVGKESETEGNMNWLAAQRSVKFEVVPSLGRELHPIRDIQTLVRLVRIIRRERPDVVHTHKSKAGAIGRLAAWLCAVPVVIHTFHGHILHGYFSETKSRMFRLIERIMANLSDRILAVSEGVKADLLRYRIAHESVIDVVPLGLDLDEFARSSRGSGTLRKELGLSSETTIVGIVARLVPIKRISVFLEAAASIRKMKPDTTFVVVGNGELRRELEETASKLALGRSTHFLGFRSDLENIYPDVDVLCLTSANEGSPVSLIEGLSAGCAIVSTDVGGVKDVLQQGTLGVLVPEGDVGALAQAVIRLLDDPARRATLGAAGKASALSRFSITRLVDDLDRLYRDCLRNSAR